ncbi:MAG: hypothetical protein EPO51_08735 [Phenylobacterium sp.]|uniref:hypothetical protein n=1 Tax=Phenylobacterium sp. TaxID=1871053 RepID=UPI00122B7834|nr:hypothetical protein [Phenylobacterium sp.]TAJ72188.1 MAG: hypothetical protein EPO51_08735 [Phenylobacterium sp.]
MTAAAPAATDTAPTAQTAHGAMLDKARAVTAKVGRLSRDFAGAHRLAQQAQVREALTRTELTLALTESLVARAELEARLRDQAVAAFRARGGGRLRRHNRLSQILDRVLSRLGSPGQALVIARSGVWRGTGRRLHDLRHMAAYARRRASPEAAPRAALDQAWYLATNADVAAARSSPLVHYLVIGGREGRDPGPLFHSAWYRRENAAELAATSLTPLEHYARVGAARGLSPHPAFDPAHYLAQAPVLAPGDEPLSHYLREGWRGGLSPHPLFDPAWYAQQAPDTGGQAPLAHYLATGWKAGLSPHPLFDPRWYVEQHAGVAEAGVEPLTHFLSNGGFEGASPSPWFDLPAYVEARGGDLAPGVHPLIDYLRGGAWAVAEARPGFPTAAYLATRPGVVRKGVTPLEHWARRGGR